MSLTASLFGSAVLGLVLLAQTAFAVNRAPIWDISAMNAIKNTFTKQIYENTTENKLLGTLLAFDPENEQVTYGVDSSNTVKVDAITGQVRLARKLDREKGDTKVDVTFYAYDPFEAGSNIRNQIDYFLRLDVQDVNDNAPDFLNLPYGASIAENSPRSTTVFRQITIEDIDDGYNAEVFVRCAALDAQSRLSCERFRVSELQQLMPRVYNCSIITNQQLDYEEQSSYILTLEARDNGRPQLSSQVNIHIKVIDVQDSPPEFLNTPINLYTDEGVGVGSKIGEVQARDGDQGNPRPVRVRIISGSNLFELVPQNPVNSSQSVYIYDVKTTGKLDREEVRGQATFQVLAIEMENGRETSENTTATVQVNIYDVNDNAPTFDQDVYSVNVSESVRATDNTQIPGLTMTVRDMDDASNARFTVFIQSQTFPGAFTVSPSNATSQGPFALAVINADYMDYENPAYRNQKVVVVAREFGTSELFSSTAEVLIRLMDVNDNSPVFNQSDYTINVNENVGPIILTQITATDADSGDNGKITYSIDTGIQNRDINQYFNIDTDTGVIRLTKPVDYEENREIPLVITASDGGSPRGEQKVTLRVVILNVNDIPPQFLSSSYETTVTETATLFQPAITVQATDTEEGPSNITYRIIQGNNLPKGPAFNVMATNGLLSMSRTVNFNETPNLQGFFLLVIEASDNANPPLTSTVNVKINVQDENNYEPRFDKISYTADVSELAPTNFTVVQVRATDDDSGANGKVRYRLQGGLGDFTINSDTGRISVSSAAQLDSATPFYRLTIFASDNGSPRQRTGTATVNVNIIDKNNKVPSFTEAIYTTTVSEEEGMNVVVLRVEASDPDQNSSLVYSILPSTITAKTPQGAAFNNPSVLNYKQSFYIDQDDGEIHIGNQLQYDKVAEMDFAVQVRDVWAETPLPIQTATASVNIRILGSVDATPRFVAPWTPEDPTYYFTIPEQTPINTLITTLVATDPIAQRSIQDFREVDLVDAGDFFVIERTSGNLIVNNILDFEKLRSKVLPVQVEAISSDGKKSAFARIRIQIQDINDNSPIFDQDRYEFQVKENSEYPFTVDKVVATDKDYGDFQKLTYSLEGQGSKNFLILGTGDVIVAPGALLDREVKPSFTLTVTATDNPGGRSQRQGSAQMIINLIDENDNRPEFSRNDGYDFLVLNEAVVGTSIGQVEATDADIGLNQRLVFAMACSDPQVNTLFYMNYLNGDIQVDGSLEGRVARYACNVTASDQGRPVRRKTVPLFIQISSGSDSGIPVFMWPPAGHKAQNVRENAGPDVEVGRMLASSPVGNVSYSFVDNSDLNILNRFNIDPDTGRVTTKMSLDREEQESYQLLIYAKVLGNTSLSSNAVLRIKVQDENDNIPRFSGKGCTSEFYTSNPPYKIYPQEDIKVGTTIFTLSACDPDDPVNTNTSYRLVTSSMDKYNGSLPKECESASESPFTLTKVDSIRVSINVKVGLDHDAITGPSHLLCIEATDGMLVAPGRKKRQNDASYYNKHDGTVAFVQVEIVDINDNRPTFPNKYIKTIMLEFPQFNSVVQKMTAVDADSRPYNKIRYSIQSTWFVGDNGVSRNITIAFDIDSLTGEVQTKQPRYTQFIGGTFFIVVRAEDTLNSNFFDTATLQIIVLQVGQKLKVTWTSNQVGNTDLKNSAQNDLREAIAGKNWELTVDELRYHIDNTGAVDATRLDACFVVVDSNGKPPDLDEVRKAILSSNSLDRPYDVGFCDKATSASRVGSGSTYWWILIVLACFIFVGTVILIIIVLYLAAKLRKKQKYERTTLIQQDQ